MKLSLQLKTIFLLLVTFSSNLGITLHVHCCFTCDKTEINIFSSRLQCHNHCQCSGNSGDCCSPFPQNSNQYTKSTCCLHEDFCYLVPFETQLEKNQRVIPKTLFFTTPFLPTPRLYLTQKTAILFTKNNGLEPPPLPYPGTPIEIAFHCLRIFPDQG